MSRGIEAINGKSESAAGDQAEVLAQGQWGAKGEDYLFYFVLLSSDE